MRIKQQLKQNIHISIHFTLTYTLGGLDVRCVVFINNPVSNTNKNKRKKKIIHKYTSNIIEKFTFSKRKNS